jgi:RHS repeat-associated protein
MSASYNGAQELTAYSDSSADMTGASYDGDGLRQSETSTPTGGSSTGQNFTWDTRASLPRLLMDSDNAYVYATSGTPIEQVDLSTGAISYLMSDSLGSVRGIVDGSDGTLTASTDYDAWGNPETSGGLTAYTPFGYAGDYVDLSGLVYLVNRYYEPATGQFTSSDPLVNVSGQPYVYVADDPVAGSDPLGLCWPSWACGVEQTVGNFVATHARTISLVAGVASYIPGVDVIALPISIVSGGLATYEDYNNGNYLSAALDAVGAGGALTAAFFNVWSSPAFVDRV